MGAGSVEHTPTPPREAQAERRKTFDMRGRATEKSKRREHKNHPRLYLPIDYFFRWWPQRDPPLIAPASPRAGPAGRGGRPLGNAAGTNAEAAPRRSQPSILKPRDPSAGQRGLSSDVEWRRANSDFIRRDIVMSMVDKAVRLGEDMLVARRRQATFESRPLQKAVCVASLVASGGVSGDAHSSVSVMEQDGLSLVASRSELLMLSMHATPLPQLCLDPIVRQTEAQAASLPSTAPIHSVIVDPTAARIFCLHADGRLLAWDGRHGALRNSASVLPGTAMALAPPRPLLCVDEESQLVLLDSSWHDHTVRILEPMSLDVHSTVAVGLPGEASGARQVAHMLYVDHVQLVLTSLEGSPCVVGCDGNDGTIRVQLGGHIDSPPALRWLSHPQLLATLGGEGDSLIRLWRLIPLEHPGGPAASVQADGVAAVDAVCERVLRGHAGAVVDAVFLPETNLLVSASVDRTVRFWDAEAAPHPLTAPEGGAHVRVAPGRYESKRPEWTSSNPPYVNCLVINTQEVPLSISALAGWRGPEGLFVLTSGAAADGSTAAPLRRRHPAVACLPYGR